MEHLGWDKQGVLKAIKTDSMLHVNSRLFSVTNTEGGRLCFAQLGKGKGVGGLCGGVGSLRGH